jgi:hypothetical protein
MGLHPPYKKSLVYQLIKTMILLLYMTFERSYVIECNMYINNALYIYNALFFLVEIYNALLISSKINNNALLRDMMVNLILW